MSADVSTFIPADISTGISAIYLQITDISTDTSADADGVGRESERFVTSPSPRVVSRGRLDPRPTLTYSVGRESERFGTSPARREAERRLRWRETREGPRPTPSARAGRGRIACPRGASGSLDPRRQARLDVASSAVACSRSTGATWTGHEDGPQCTGHNRARGCT